MNFSYLYLVAVVSYPSFDSFFDECIDSYSKEAYINFSYPIGFYFTQKCAEEAKKQHPYYQEFQENNQDTYYSGQIIGDIYSEVSIINFNMIKLTPYLLMPHGQTLESKRRVVSNYNFHREDEEINNKKIVLSPKILLERALTGDGTKISSLFPRLYLVEQKLGLFLDNQSYGDQINSEITNNNENMSDFRIRYDYEIYDWKEDDKFFQLCLKELTNGETTIIPIIYQCLYDPRINAKIFHHQMDDIYE